MTDQHIHFHSWHILKGVQIDSIDLKKIDRLILEEFENGFGTIYLLGDNMGNFKNTEHHPALVSIENAKKVENMIKDIIK